MRMVSGGVDRRWWVSGGAAGIRRAVVAGAIHYFFC